MENNKRVWRIADIAEELEDGSAGKKIEWEGETDRSW